MINLVRTVKDNSVNHELMGSKFFEHQRGLFVVQHEKEFTLVGRGLW